MASLILNVATGKASQAAVVLRADPALSLAHVLPAATRRVRSQWRMRGRPFSPKRFGTNHSYLYTYAANSPLLQDTEFRRGSNTMMLTSRGYDRLNRMERIGSQAAGGGLWRYDYAYNAAHQRTRTTFADNSRWDYGYDALGQVTNGVRRWPDNRHIAGQQFSYAFDDIGNRLGAGSGGDTNGASLRTQSYTPNDLNQLTSRTVPGYVEVVGVALGASVTVNGAAAERQADYFRKELTVANTGTPVWQAVTVQVVRTNATNVVAGNRFVAPALESYTHDADGNLTADGRYTYSWDAENRLVVAEANGSVPAAARRKLEFAYDAYGRRIQKIVSAWNGSAYVGQSTNRFLYDGWNLVAILDSQSSILSSFCWGNDLSGSRSGAGGVGGLLSVTLHTGTNAGTYYVAQDGNGNVMALVNATNGVAAAQYEYGPFGELIRASGPLALANPFRFSTKYQDDETGFLYYGYRYYNPEMGRWASRDPIEERGGKNLHALMKNDSVNDFDILGLVGGAVFPIGNGEYMNGWTGERFRPAPYIPVSQIPEDWSDRQIFEFLASRWTDGTGKEVTLSQSAVKRMLSRGANKDETEQLIKLVEARCKLKAKQGRQFGDASDSIRSVGAEKEAWYLGGHTRELSVWTSCCSKKYHVTLKVTDKWDFDEDVWYSDASLKNIASWGVGGFIGFGAWWNVQAVPVTGTATIVIQR